MHSDNRRGGMRRRESWRARSNAWLYLRNTAEPTGKASHRLQSNQRRGPYTL